MSYFHSVTLDKDKCRGCTNCVKRCPTEAIRVRNGKAKIIKTRCIDCGECIRVCPYHAKRAVTDSFDELDNYKYNVALPAPSLYGQFGEVSDINVILTGLKEIGFDDVFEVARGAEYISAATREKYEKYREPGPAISSACPAVIRLIRVRFPNLIHRVIDLISPMEAASQLARLKAVEKTGLDDKEIGTFFITPCPAKMTSIKSPLTLKESSISGAISVNDVFARLYPMIGSIEPQPLMKASMNGVYWSRSGGESDSAGIENYIAVDGIENVIKILEEIEDDKVSGIDFVELSACLGGCVGGVLNVVNGFIAKNKIKSISKNIPKAAVPCRLDADINLRCTQKLEYAPVMQLDEDFDKAMEMMDELEDIYDSLPKLDCGSCGAPSCRALAEDIVCGYATKNYCIIDMKKKIEEMDADKDNRNY